MTSNTMGLFSRSCPQEGGSPHLSNATGGDASDGAASGSSCTCRKGDTRGLLPALPPTPAAADALPALPEGAELLLW